MIDETSNLPPAADDMDVVASLDLMDGADLEPDAPCSVWGILGGPDTYLD